jgi:hypothetical protein
VAPGGGTGPTVSVLAFVGRVPHVALVPQAADNFGMHLVTRLKEISDDSRAS